ncbi:MAG: hypothetical protein JWO36_5092 [Myxococcales bacterium]|nr:hypothetical protein [Myxococcales bacterium]
MSRRSSRKLSRLGVTLDPMRRIAVVRVLLCAVAACTPKVLMSPSETPTDVAKCELLANHLLEVMQPDGAAADTVDAIRIAISRRCFEDKWSLDASQCFLEAEALEATDHCATRLTVGQRDAFERAVAAAIK